MKLRSLRFLGSVCALLGVVSCADVDQTSDETAVSADNLALPRVRVQRVSRQISTGTTTIGVHYGVHDSVLVYSDTAVGPATDPLSTTDIMLADVADPTRRPRTVARQAHDLFFTTPDRRFVVYTSDAEAGGGLFVAFIP